MQLDHQFTVPAPVDEAWQVLLDVPRVAPCMPGATLDEFDGETFTGSVKVKLGPINLLYKGQGRFVETDEAAHRVVLAASGKESRGSGTAAATVTAALVADGDHATKVDVTTELRITGRPAQFGRGMLNDVGGKLLDQFASCLATTLGETSASQQATSAEPTESSVPPNRMPAPHSPDVGDGRSAAGLEYGSGDAEVEPIDLLKVTGAQTMLRRYGPMVAAAGALMVVTWLVARRRR
ncbi:SRPBCC family protein [Haloactinopolyspora sp.]|uniref:SRPBCC family protein n=1 Tax=Haloactinopolyspora sp. TaxID=1966353 RepID=UPI00262F41C1|nr:SRPBCC family protein [Haloactinopolyspora sp.]